MIAILTGVITWWITRSWERLNETRRMQREFFTMLIANRHNLKGDHFTQALNGCAVVFAESKDVQTALIEFHKEVSKKETSKERADDSLLNLIRCIIKFLDLQIYDLPDDFLLKPFNPHPDSIE